MSTRMSVAVVLLVCTCLTSMRAAGAERFTIRAPIDGFVAAVPPKGSLHDASPPPVSSYLARLSASLQTNGLQVADDAKKPESYDFGSLQTGSSVRFMRNSGARVEQTRETIYLPGIGNVPLQDLRADGLGKLLAAVEQSKPVVVVEAPITQYQLLEAMQALVAAQLSLDIANARLAREYGPKPEEGWKHLQMEQIEANRKYRHYSRDAQAAEAKDHASDINKWGKAEALQTANLDRARLAFNVDTELLGKARIAEAQVQAAWGAVQSIDATLLLGQITCPRRCKVVDVHAYANQPVTKGDPLVDVQFVE